MSRPGLWTPDQGYPDGARARDFLRDQRRRERDRWRHIRDPRVDTAIRHAAVTRVATANRNDSSGTAVTTTTSLNVASGDNLIVAVNWEDEPPSSATSVTDTATNTYTPGTLVSFSGTVHCQWFWCLNAAAHATNTVQVNFGSSAVHVSITAIQYRGLKTTGTANVQATNNGGSGSTSAATFKLASAATTTATCILLALFGVYTTVDYTPQTDDGVAWTEINDGTHSAPMEKLNSGNGFTAGNYNASTVASGNDAWAVAFAAFEVDAGGGGGAAPRRSNLLTLGVH